MSMRASESGSPVRDRRGRGSEEEGGDEDGAVGAFGGLQIKGHERVHCQPWGLPTEDKLASRL